VPWVLWIALVVGLGLAGFVGWQAAACIARYRLHMGLPSWYLPAAGAVLITAGQVAFVHARRTDRRWWRLKRAPELPMSQTHVGDAVWVRGKLECDSPLIAPYTTHECAYYRYQVRERKEDEPGWRTTDRGTRAVDFRIVEDERSVYVPSGGVLFDAALYGESFLGPSGTRQVKVWLLPVGLPTSVCGQLAGEAQQRWMAALGEGLPVVATWRRPEGYVKLTARLARRSQVAAWALTILGALALIASVACLY
jgi:hypothetical protein